MRGMKAACLWIIFHFSTPHTHTSFSQAVVGERQAWVFGLGRESAMKTFLVAIITGGSLLHHVVGLFHVARLGFLYWF